MVKKIVFFFLFLSIFSCNQKINKPENLLDRRTFKTLITQIYIYKQSPSIPMKKNIPLEEISLAILKKYHVSPESFKNSLEYYMLENSEFNKILTEIQDSLSKTLPKEENIESAEDFLMEEDLK